MANHLEIKYKFEIMALKERTYTWNLVLSYKDKILHWSSR